MHAMKDPTPLFRAAAIVLFFATFAVLTACGCAQHAAPPTGEAPHADVEVGATVEIFVVCADGRAGYGSGTAISASEVLTARHVAQGCNDHGGGIYTAQLAGADPVILVPDVDVETSDVALMAAPPGSFAMARPAFGSAMHIGDRVCWSAAFPRRERHCADVAALEGGRAELDMPVEPGNSGSGLWNTRGQLVGVIVTYTPAPSTGQIVGGGAIDVTGMRWMGDVL